MNWMLAAGVLGFLAIAGLFLYFSGGGNSSTGTKSSTKAVPTIPHVYEDLRNDQLMFQVAGYSVPIERNVRLLKALYGIDADRDML